MDDNLAIRTRELIDRQDILDCIYRCARGMDRHDSDLIASAYHSDAFDDHGTFSGPVGEFIDYINGANGAIGVHERRFVNHQHNVTNHVVELNGDTAHSETYYIMFGQLRGSTGVAAVGGRYLDRFERRDDRWAIALRRVVVEWSETLDNSPSFDPATFDKFIHGTWNRDDMSYRRPLSMPEDQFK